MTTKQTITALTHTIEMFFADRYHYAGVEESENKTIIISGNPKTIKVTIEISERRS